VEEEVVVDITDFVANKKNGMLIQVDDGYYSMRIRVTGGNVTADQFALMASLARKYGNGSVHITSRQGVEIPFVHISDLEDYFADLAEAGLQMGATGPRVRAVVACQGENVCTNGLMDTTALANQIADRFFGKELPHKFKIAITGCPSNCLKAEENDLGIKGVAPVTWSADKCVYCGSCAKNCPVKAIEVTKNNFAIDKNVCIDCGKCSQICPVAAIAVEKGFKVTMGGTFGRHIVIGKQAYPFMQSEEQLFKFIACTLEFYQEYGQPKERINKTLVRVGWNVFSKFLQDRTGIIISR
jgi:dissimilatory sulfite reductase (desulfoviridin) alpha/beta subunit